MMKRPPFEVRAWPMEDILGLVAYSELESEQFRKRTGSGGAPAGAPGEQVKTTTTRFVIGKRPPPTRG